MRPTVIKKCVCAICTVAILMLILVECRMNDWIYKLLRPELQNSVSVVASAVGTRLSYILHQNTQYLLRFWTDTDLMQMVLEYQNEVEEGQNKLYETICERLQPEILGKTELGAIHSSRYVFLIVDGQYLGSEELKAGAEAMMKSQWFQQLPETLHDIEDDFKESIPRCYSPVFSQNSNEQEMIYYVMPRIYESQMIYVVMVEAFSDFKDLFGDLKEAESGELALIGYDEKILFTNKTPSVFEKMSQEEICKLFPEGQYEVKLEERKADTLLGIRISYKIENLRLVVSLKKSDFLKPYIPFRRMTGKLLIGFTVILLMLIILILKKILFRLEKLSKQMQQIKQENYNLEEQVSGSDEVGMLADSFYQMMDQIQVNLNTIREQEAKEHRIEYSLLVSQINPHFIYNTLNTITYLAELNRTKDIMVINKALIGMLRDRLQISGLQIFDNIKEEAKQLESYITIQRYLCSGEIDYEFCSMPECENVLYPKNVLQPLVENSILHGLLLHRNEDGKLVPGKIRILIRKQDKQVITEVLDNGVGMNRKQIEEFFECNLEERFSDIYEKGKRAHIGISNIRMRMKYLYEDAFQMQVFLPDEGGLKIVFTIPYKAN